MPMPSQPEERDRATALIEAEIAVYNPEALSAQGQKTAAYHRRVLSEFLVELVDPQMVKVNFSGGFVQTCWAVTRGGGTYRVIYLPRAGYFSLVIETGLGLVDMGIHGPAIACFESV